MRFNLRGEWPLLLIVAAMFAVAFLSWPFAPARFPVHWGLRGIDGYGSPLEGVFLNPVIALGLYLATLLLPRIDPGRANYAQFGGAYFATRLVILLFMALTYAMMQLAAHGYQINVITVAMVLFGGLLVAIGNFMGKLRPNWFIGIRTPWTLSSKVSWDRTHRLGGWLFIAGGFLMIASTMAPPAAGLAICLAIPLTMVGVLFVYSYFAWRGDPNKQPPAGTIPAETH